MDTVILQLENWLFGLKDSQPVGWSQLSDIGLYMDQVVTYIDRQLSVYRHSDKEHVLTPAMVNNYIKDALLPRADMKKYAPNHLALLTMIGALKQVLSMQDLQILLSGTASPEQTQAFYQRFLTGQNRVVREMSDQVSQQLSLAAEADQNEQQLQDLALDLAIEARVRILISEQILTLLAQNQQAERAKAAVAEQAAKAVKVKNKKAKEAEPEN